MTRTIEVGGRVGGGVIIPFGAVCIVNDRPFAGTVTVSWSEKSRVPEYDALARAVARITKRKTTCEGIAIAVRGAMKPQFKTGVTVRVDVTNESHLRAWAVAK